MGGRGRDEKGCDTLYEKQLPEQLGRWHLRLEEGGGREGRSFGECGCGGEEAGCRREVVPNLHVGATSVYGSGVTCCVVGRGVCGRIAVHEFA